MVGGVEMEMWIFAKAFMARPQCRSPKGWQPKRGVLAMPMDVGERVAKVDVDWLCLG
jgi:hypothetical protein